MILKRISFPVLLILCCVANKKLEAAEDFLITHNNSKFLTYVILARLDSIERGLTAIGRYDKDNLISWVSDQTILADIFIVNLPGVCTDSKKEE
jgi:hypothetical protein